MLPVVKPSQFSKCRKRKSKMVDSHEMVHQVHAAKAEDLSSILRTREEGFCFHLYIRNVSSVCAYTSMYTPNKNARKKLKILKLSKLTELR